MKIFANYTLTARMVPAFLCSLPVILLMYFSAQTPEVKLFSDYLAAIKIGGISAYLLFLYFFAHVIRATSKYYENKYFINNKGFPTTYLMAYSDSKYTTEYKVRYKEKLKQHLNWELRDEEQERANYGEAKKRLDEATRLIIPYVGDGILVKSYNVWYGFVRNLIGGLVYSLLFCAINVWICQLLINKPLLLYFSCVLFTVYLVLYIFRKTILRQYAENYADKLIAEFMTIEKRTIK